MPESEEILLDAEQSTEERLRDIELLMYGNKRTGMRGIADIVREMEAERKSTKAVMAGVGLGLSLNGAISLATLLKILGGS